MQELTAIGPKQSFAIEQVERSEILHGAQIFIVQPGRVSQRRFVRLRKSLHGLRRKNGSNGGQIEQGGAPSYGYTASSHARVSVLSGASRHARILTIAGY